MELAWHQLDQYLELARKGDERTQAAGRVLLAGRTNDVTLLCDLAFMIATAPRLEARDFVLANEALDRAEKLATTNATRVMITRAVVLFESGKQDEGLARANQALASAQSPIEKTNVLSLIRTMERRRTARKNRRASAGQDQLPLEQGPSSSIP